MAGEKKPDQAHTLFLKFWDFALSAVADGSNEEVYESSDSRIEAGPEFFELFGNLFLEMRVQIPV